MLQQFLLVAGAHFLALLSPGPDFFLILRYAIALGRGPAALVSLGIGLANGLFILLAMGGLMALDAEAGLFIAVQWAGGVFLLYMGIQFIRQAGQTRLEAGSHREAEAPASTAPGALLAGLASGLLNPKNALFYASLFAVLHARSTPAGVQSLYALWMIAVVLGWDLLVGHLAGHPVLIRRFAMACDTSSGWLAPCSSCWGSASSQPGSTQGCSRPSEDPTAQASNMVVGIFLAHVK